jgi:hypothetical protein
MRPPPIPNHGCTAFLVAPDLAATAGHCTLVAPLEQICLVFGYEMRDDGRANLDVHRDHPLAAR